MIARRRLDTYGRYQRLLRCDFARVRFIEDSLATMTTPSMRRASHNLFSNECSKPEPPSRYRLHEGHNEDYFHFTRGRFVSNEQNEISQRYVRFNLHGLARLAAKAVGSKSCVGIEKYPDGMYNKALLLTMEDGTQVVAKVPNPNAGRPHFTTASEVATMEFVCLIALPQLTKLIIHRSRRSSELRSQRCMHGAPEHKTIQ